MGVFSKPKMPNALDEFEINQKRQLIKYYNEFVTKSDNIEGFLNGVKSLKNAVKELVKYEKKYPYYFKSKPSQILMNFGSNKLVLEKNFIDRYIVSIERKLLDYSTARGKTNNFNKKVDLFMYYAEEFEPENIKYFEMKLNERFSEFF